jgi:hypothetical protein
LAIIFCHFVYKKIMNIDLRITGELGVNLDFWWKINLFCLI